jgi:hypothetical protein
MKKFIAATIVALSIASPAFAQSFDPDCGTCNVVPFAEAPLAREGGTIVLRGEHSYASDPRGAIRNETYGQDNTGGGSPGYNEMLRNW